MAGIAVAPFTEKALTAALRNLPLGGLRYYEKISSTNDFALAWATEGAPDLGLVIANEQTAGRGRGQRTWYTPTDAALAFSLVLRPKASERDFISSFTGLGALAVCCTIEDRYGLKPLIKWPNDVLLNGRKFCGILAEMVWVGEEPESIVLGIGLNISKNALPTGVDLNFPATSLEAEIQSIPDRVALLRDTLIRLLEWRPRIATPAFVDAWDGKLAFKGEPVHIRGGSGNGVMGILEGLNSDGSLRMNTGQGKPVTVQFGEVHLRPGI